MTYEEYYSSAEEKYAAGCYAEALNLFQQAHNINQTNDCSNYIGCCFLNLKDLTRAEAIFKTLIRMEPDWERPLFNLGRVYLAMGRMEDACQCFERALFVNQYSQDANFYYGVYLYKAQNHLKAKYFFEKSLQLDDEQPETHLHLGNCLYQLGMIDQAIQQYDLAYAQDHMMLEAPFNKGKALAAMHEYGKAIEAFLQTVSERPQDEEAIFDIAHCYYKIDDYEKSRMWLEALLSLQPSHPLGKSLRNKLDAIDNEQAQK